MTTNQTIDGVPRKLLENCANYTEGSASYEVLLWHKELRALLDAPAVESELARMARRCQNAELALKVQTENYEALKAAQPQGKPVYMVRSHGSCCWEEMRGESLEMCQAQPGEYEVRKLYAEQPAPVAVLMSFDFEHPSSKERRTVALSKQDVFNGMEDYFYEKLGEQICRCEPVGETNVVDCSCDEYVHDFEIVKACLDELKRLNPSL